MRREEKELKNRNHGILNILHKNIVSIIANKEDLRI